MGRRPEGPAVTKPTWFGYRRITLAGPQDGNYSDDPTTVILGAGPDEPLPDDPNQRTHQDQHDLTLEEHVLDAKELVSRKNGAKH